MRIGLSQAVGTLAFAVDAIEALDALSADPDIGARLARLDVIPARPARYGETEKALHPEVLERLAARGAERLYVHQAEAIDRLRAGRSVALATGTGSGKSLCYQAPITESVLAGWKDTALLLFPTKALAHDQLRSLRSWLVPGMRAVAYDGDTPTEERASLRRTANVMLTNPEMLHTGILPYHDRWATFLMRLRYVVVDELHTLRGIFGSHVAHLLRRLRRVCLHYGAQPASASPAPPSAIPPPWPPSCAGCRSTPSTTTGRPGGPGRWPSSTGRWSTRPRAGGRRPPPRWARSWPLWSAPASGRSPSPRAGAAPSWSPARPSAGSGTAPPPSPGRWPPTGAATCPRNAASWRRPSPRESCSVSPPPTPWSSASTWPASTPSSSRGSRGRWRRSGNRPAGPAGPSSRRRRSSWPATISSTAGTSTTPPSSSPGRWSRRW